MMRTLGVLLALAASARAVTVYTAGDSTMARGGGGNGTDGWAQYLAQYLAVPVVNDAVAGRSARSYTDEGRFAALIAAAQAGDVVVIEFGHNDGTASPDNGRQDAVGAGYDTTAVVTAANGTQILVHSFPFYVQNAAAALQARGAVPLLSSQTPDDIWAGAQIAAPPRFVGYMATAAARTGAAYVDHFAYVAQAYEALGEAAVAAFYPMDHTHTSPAGANVVAEAFVRGVLCGGSQLVALVNAKGRAVPGGCV